MADAISKFLKKLSKKERELLIGIIDALLWNKPDGLQIKKLVGSDDIFRARKGVFRIVYRRTKTDCIILSVDRRNEKTYRDI